ncbi:MAG: ComEA family DNA-binding protein [Oscillospiraceae bacterium]
MKISGVEKGILALTAAFLLLTVGYFLGQRSGGEPYSVSAQTLWTQEEAAAQTGTEPAAERSVQKVNINTAGAAELQTLPGIGQVRAEQIVADREANGPFQAPEEITRVSGIGQGTLEQILDYITVE